MIKGQSQPGMYLMKQARIDFRSGTKRKLNVPPRGPSKPANALLFTMVLKADAKLAVSRWSCRANQEARFPLAGRGKPEQHALTSVGTPASHHDDRRRSSVRPSASPR